ncbi:hypothetical protein I4U23_022308 [Adineta vaga]|nr:hypothetical protein I4U23_022308 [Adineta vaga]
MLLSSITLNEQIQKTMNDFQTKMPQLFINTLLLIRETTGAYILMNTLSTNSVIDYSSEIINGYAMHNIPSSYNGCSCALSSKSDCYPLESILQSTLVGHEGGLVIIYCLIAIFIYSIWHPQFYSDCSGKNNEADWTTKIKLFQENNICYWCISFAVYQRSKPIVNLKINPSVINLTQNDSMQLQSPLPYLTEEDFERSKTLTNEQIGINLTDLREELPKQSSSARANVWRDSRYKWPNARVPYVISSRYNSNERAVIAQVIQEWHSKTCIRFAPKTNADRDYIELTPDDGTSNYCYSYIGRQGGRQYVKMYSPTCMSVGQYIHELGHAVGFGHEHQRPDRDYYVKMNWANIDPKFQYNYDKYSADYFTTMNMPYDYYSIMHYPDYSYSSNGKPAFVPTYPGYNIHAMNVKLTSTDIQKVKKYYNC